MVHQYRNNGYNIVLDVNSGAIHVVDDLTYRIIELYKENDLQGIEQILVADYDQKMIQEAYEEVLELVNQGELFSEEEYEMKNIFHVI